MSASLLARLRASFPVSERSPADVKGHTSRLKTVFSKAYEMHTKYNGNARVAILIETDGGRIMYDSDFHTQWAPIKREWTVGTLACEMQKWTVTKYAQEKVDIVQPSSFITQDDSATFAKSSTAAGSSTISHPGSIVSHRIHETPATPPSLRLSPSVSDAQHTCSTVQSPTPFLHLFEGDSIYESCATSPDNSIFGQSRKRSVDAVEEPVENLPAVAKVHRPLKRSKQLFK